MTASELMERLPDMLDSVPEPPEITEDQVISLEEEDPQTYIFINRAKARPPRPARLGGDGKLRLIRPDTREKMAVSYRRKNGSYDKEELARLDRFLRCRVTGQTAVIPTRLLEIMDAVEDKFDGKPLIIMSAYRTPAHNKHLPGAARWSLHMLGWAADIRIAGVPPAEIYSFASGLKAGGVGHYPAAGFVHLDAGRARSWETRAARKAASR